MDKDVKEIGGVKMKKQKLQEKLCVNFSPTYQGMLFLNPDSSSKNKIGTTN